MAFMLMGPVVRAQTDSVVKPSDTIIVKTTDSTVKALPVGDIQTVDKVFGVTIPPWVENVFFALLTVLPAIQIILKRIPTSVSIKIGGIIGKLLDILTFFQKDKNATGGNHT